MILFVAASAMSSEISVRHVDKKMFVERQPPTEIGSKAVVRLFEFYSNVFPHSEIRL